MTDARDRTITKIRKLQQLALRAGTAEEAATAARRAYELAAAHGITAAELEDHDRPAQPEPPPSPDRQNRRSRVNQQPVNMRQAVRDQAMAVGVHPGLWDALLEPWLDDMLDSWDLAGLRRPRRRKI